MGINEVNQLFEELKGKSRYPHKVEALQIIRGLAKTRDLEGTSMICNLPLGANGDTIIIPPEIDPNNCKGLLKEEIQTLIIERLHQYILDNIGDIAESLKGTQSVIETSENVVESNVTNNSG